MVHVLRCTFVINLRAPTCEPNVCESRAPTCEPNQCAIYEHINRVDEEQKVLLYCKYCTKTWCYFEDVFKKTGSSTSNHMKHVKSHHKRQYAGNSNALLRPMDGYLQNSSSLEKKIAATSDISDDLIREAIENVVLSEAEAFTIIESKLFLKLLKILLKCKRDNVIILKADALRNGILKRAENMRSELKKELSKSNFTIHMSLDMWTSPNQFSFLAIVIHFVGPDWTLHKKLLTFTDTTDHSGAGLAEIVQHTLEEFEIVERIGCLTMDNASNNDTLMSALENSIVDYCIREKILKTWNADDSRIQCLPHTINLSVKAFLKSLGEIDDILIDDEIPNRNDFNLIRRLRFIVKKLRSSPQQRKQFRGQCNLANCENLMLILDVSTRWNST
ncbi:hypothetical protein Mp_1g22340 [Marchantia polymorpha subsp. ruderalis]|uniref:BED-type domain-containing protein n=2 Tax=Marchantia polymorpha TaxID=3197 RepID=A0AAF6AT33_MARPO|nr:hypothetical protein MARPO_0001s0572 [Marchantia polymorpha]BBM99603.1 hypothetical protein Mp_1g22340 [Marchantia polymorpha subsp. ruderalis]|eukprot:PTQ50691.1 hypothetical protein MARPO_0001s0572 [Marchantia polymorpha]